MTKRQIVIYNLTAFAVIQFIFEVSVTTGQSGSYSGTNIAAPVFVQYIISWWIVKGKIDQKDKEALIKYTWTVSICVFLLRLILGFMVFGISKM